MGPIAESVMACCPNSSANRTLFLYCYSLYLAGEKRKEEEILEKNKGGAVCNREIRELRNTNMAIESDRRALDINPLDFRAWYGLGQTDEIFFNEST